MWRWEYHIFNLTHDYKINYHGKIWVGAKFGSCRFSGKGDITFLICYMTSCEHTIRESCDFMCGFSLPYIIALPSAVAIDLVGKKLFRF